MTEADRPQFGETIAALCVTVGRQLPPAAYQGYWLGLSDLPLAAVKTAVTKALRQPRRGMPTPGELRELAGILPPTARAVKAWDVVERARTVDGHDYYHSVDFDDPLCNATIRNLGGWMRFCERFDEDEAKWIRREFERVYVLLATHGVNENAAQPLVGFFEANNRAAGYLNRIKPACRIACNLPPVPLAIEAVSIPQLEARG